MNLPIHFNVHQLKILNSNQGNLDIKTKQTDERTFQISPEGRPSFYINAPCDHPAFVQELKRALQHYPNKVTIDSNPLETTPYQNLASLAITVYREDSTRSYSFTPLPVTPDTDQAAKYNTLAAGVLTYIPSLSQKETTYFTPGEQPAPIGREPTRSISTQKP